MDVRTEGKGGVTGLIEDFADWWIEMRTYALIFRDFDVYITGKLISITHYYNCVCLTSCINKRHHLFAVIYTEILYFNSDKHYQTISCGKNIKGYVIKLRLIEITEIKEKALRCNYRLIHF